MTPRAEPPRWMEAVLEAVTRGMRAGETVVGDLAEGYRGRRARGGPVGASVWYLSHIVSLAAHLLVNGVRAAAAAGIEPTARELFWTLRGMVRRPWFGLGVVTILALAISATTASVSLALGTYRAAVWWDPGENAVSLWPGQAMSLGQLLALRQESELLGDAGAWMAGTSSVEDAEGRSRSVPAVTLSPTLFDALAVEPVLGRGLVPDDEAVGAEPVVVLGQDLWRTSFGGDPGVVGTLLEVDGVLRRVVGVQGAGGTAPGVGTELWIPVVMNAFDEDFWPRQSYALVARLPAGVVLEDARNELRRVLQVLAARFSFFYQPDYGLDATVAAANEPVWAPLRTPLALLLVGSVFLLLVAAIDLGNLFLGRSLERAGELRVRAVLGASRGRIVGQLLAEGLLWTLLGLGAGLGLGIPLATRLAAVFPVGSQVVSLGPGREMAGLALFSGVLVWVLMSGVPTAHFLRATRTALVPSRFAGHRAQGALVVTQAALATTLMIGAGLLLRSVENLRAVPVGFDPEDVVALQVIPNDQGREAELPTFYETLVDGVGDASGAVVGTASTVPFRDPVPASPINRLDAPTEVAAAPRAYRQVVGGDYFAALGIPVRQGRAFTADDRAGSEEVAMVNAALARELWPGESALGRRIAVDPHDWERWLTVVGVVGDVRFGDLTGGVEPAYYVPHAQAPERAMYLLIAGGGGVASIASTARAEVAELDAATPVGPALDVARVVADAYGAVRILMALLVVLAVLATVLGAVGLYGALASYVTRHRVELGTRLALGARPARLFGGVVGVGVALTLAGVALGSVLAALGGGLVRTLLVGVSPLDPGAFAVSALTLALVGGTAAAIPALRAAMVAPAEVLKEA